MSAYSFLRYININILFQVSRNALQIFVFTTTNQIYFVNYYACCWKLTMWQSVLFFLIGKVKATGEESIEMCFAHYAI